VLNKILRKWVFRHLKIFINKTTYNE
jgi:hypothetical protein